MPGLPVLSSAVGQEVDEAAGEATAPCAPDLQRGAHAAARLCPLLGPFLPEHCPSFTKPAARRGHQIPCLFWTLYFIISVE